MSIKLLDCTLRDGGYINDWNFGKKTIIAILDKLEKAKIDIIECGFLTGMVKDEECSLFNSTEEIENLIPKRQSDSMYVAMIAIGEKELLPNKLSLCSKKGITGIRLTFHMDEIEKAIDWGKIIMEKGYKLFMQPVGSIFYSDMELLKLLEKINKLKPYAFYIVDTLGSMYRNQVSYRFNLIDENMNQSIHLGFHAHNNLQLAFSNAQILGKIQTKRTLILDSSVYGMGRGAGNLPTELITRYINKNIESKYDVNMIMDIYDEYISKIKRNYDWGYSVAYNIAASNVCHPNYAAYLINKKTLTMKDIEKIILSIPDENRGIYDKNLIEKLYSDFQNNKIDDRKSIKKISDSIKGKKVLILAPGKSLISEREAVLEFIEKENPYTISVNFLDLKKYNLDACFINNSKKADAFSDEIKYSDDIQTILTSNIPDENYKNCVYINYDSYKSDDKEISDNSELMLLKLLENCVVKDVTFAGFDGFDNEEKESYYYDDVSNQSKAQDGNNQQRIKEQIDKFSKKMNIKFLTSSVYDSGR